MTDFPVPQVTDEHMWAIADQLRTNWPGDIPFNPDAVVRAVIANLALHGYAVRPHADIEAIECDRNGLVRVLIAIEERTDPLTPTDMLRRRLNGIGGLVRGALRKTRDGTEPTVSHKEPLPPIPGWLPPEQQ